MPKSTCTPLVWPHTGPQIISNSTVWTKRYTSRWEPTDMPELTCTPVRSHTEPQNITNSYLYKTYGPVADLPVLILPEGVRFNFGNFFTRVQTRVETSTYVPQKNTCKKTRHVVNLEMSCAISGCIKMIYHMYVNSSTNINAFSLLLYYNYYYY